MATDETEVDGSPGVDFLIRLYSRDQKYPATDFDIRIADRDEIDTGRECCDYPAQVLRYDCPAGYISFLRGFSRRSDLRKRRHRAGRGQRIFHGFADVPEAVRYLLCVRR